MAQLYGCSNAYVSPYAAEGFNLPVLESMASGTPVIVPRGGSTDDFTNGRFTRYISAVLGENMWKRRILNVNYDSLSEEMEFVVTDYLLNNSKWLKPAGKAATKFAQQYTWSIVLDKLLCEIGQKMIGDHKAFFMKSCPK
jgi:glycosyltransferase involved in cell wall biosynthesis